VRAGGIKKILKIIRIYGASEDRDRKETARRAELHSVRGIVGRNVPDIK
jgi:hypothetical protein